jgi:dihydrofolate reductase
VAKLIYSAIASLDGFVADPAGTFDWAAPDEEVHRFVNQLEEPIGTYLYGRRMFDVMQYWDSADAVVDQPDYARDYARIWRAAEKVVFSSSVTEVATARTRIEARFDPTAVQELKTSADRDLSVGGPTLAQVAIRAGLVDEIQVIFVPHVVGGGTHFLGDGTNLELALVDERRFTNGQVYLRYLVEHARG